MQGYMLKRDGGGGRVEKKGKQEEMEENLDTEKERWKRGGKGI